MAYKRNIKCYQCKHEKTLICKSCNDEYSKLDMKEEYTSRLIKKS